MGMEQESEWNAAQSIKISEDLVAAAKLQLKFLAAVDRNRWLYEDQTLQRAIYRYNSCWLPLLAKHSDSRVTNGPLVVPLDCEWVWHCHRLNPVRYKSDCEEFYGRILDNCNVASSVENISRKETEEIWNTMYPDEPYDINSTRSDKVPKNVNGSENYTKYNLVLAIKRQIPFYYQVSRPHMNTNQFLEAAVARYKGFLHLIKRNKERSITCFCVPTYDIDLIWHTHQLHPASYSNDLMKSLGKILEHDDTDQNRGKGQKLDIGFSKTIKQWEALFGSRYWKAGAMYRGSTPSPLTVTPFIPKLIGKEVTAHNKFRKLIDLPESHVIEVVLEFVEIENLPETYKKRVCVHFSKAQPDGIFDVKRKLNIQSEFGRKQVATFQCKPTGKLFFELVSDSTSDLLLPEPVKTLGCGSIALEDLVSNLSVEKWLDLVPSSDTISSDPVRLKVAASCTVPMPAPHVLKIARTSHLSKSFLTQVTDENGNEIIGLQMREMKELIGITKEGEAVMGQLIESEWSLMDSLWTVKVQKMLLTGPHTVKLVPGRKLDYEPKHHERKMNIHNFMTAVEFSAEYPYGRAIALLDVSSGDLMVQEAWFVLPGIMLAFIFLNILRKDVNDGENLKETEFMSKEAVFKAAVAKDKLASGSCGSGCGGGCGNMVNSGGCGSGCGGGCGNMVNSGGCGSGCGGGCGGGCGNMVSSGGCGAGCGGGCGGCGGGCGNMVNSSGCGGCGGGCGNMVKSGCCGGCGGGCGGCGGGCGGSMMKSGCLDNITGGPSIDEQPMQVAAHA
ncbi:putative Glycine-rich domain-containing protein [Helianthus annuus]|nr:putative Glycine-rich domain-containing protein [Helianthus annuus]